MHHTIKTIAGIDCIFAPMNDANSITIEVLIKAWSVYETREDNGISHFLEHMFFKWGKKYKTPKAVAQAVEQFGGEFNAFTSLYYAGYYVKAAPDFTHQACDVLADMLVHSQFPKPELEREKGVVLQEIAMYEDEPQEVVSDKRQQRYYGDNSYGRPTLGTTENVKSFSQEDLFTHKKSLYTKDNLIIIVAGKIHNQNILEEHIHTLFQALPEKKKKNKPDYPRVLPSQSTSFFEKWTQQNHLIFAMPGFTRYEQEKYAAKVFMTIVGGNMSSRLFQNVREKEGLCYYISWTHSAGPDDGAFYIRAGIDKERFNFGVEKINKELDILANKGITKKEFENTIGYITGQVQMGIESSDSLAMFLGTQYLLYNKIRTLEDILKKYNKLSLSEINKVRENLASEKRFLYYVK